MSEENKYNKVILKCKNCDADVTYGQMVDDLGYVCNICDEFVPIDKKE